MSRRAMLFGASLPLFVALAACARNADPRSAVDSAREMELSGRVVNSGGGPERFAITTLQVANTGPTRLVGGLLAELRALAGADVKVRGVLDSTGAARSLSVREYEVLSIDGRRPHVGRVLFRDAAIWLAGDDTLRLVPELQALREQVGAKIWVVGSSDPEGKELRVESYGVIAAAPSPAVPAP